MTVLRFNYRYPVRGRKPYKVRSLITAITGFNYRYPVRGRKREKADSEPAKIVLDLITVTP